MYLFMHFGKGSTLFARFGGGGGLLAKLYQF